MTEDTSPENLRKFLESDDPAMVRMGIAMAKGAGVEVTVEDLERFLKSDVSTIKVKSSACFTRYGTSVITNGFAI